MKSLVFVFFGMLITTAPCFGDNIKLQRFKTPEQGQEITNRFAYALASVDRGVPKEAEKVLEDLLNTVSYDRRLFGYTRIAITYFQLDKTADARAVLQKIVNSLQGEVNQVLNKANLADAYMDAGKFSKADTVLEEIAFECGPDRKTVLREINIARAAIAVKQYAEAAIQVKKIVQLLENENHEDAGVFEFSLDSGFLDSFAGADAH